MKNPNAAWMPLNLQLFADPASEGGAEPVTTEPATASAATEGSQQMPPALTMEDVMRIVQSESDKRVTQALAKQRKEYEKRLSLSGLDEQERQSREKDQRIEELETNLREAQVQKNHLELVRTLAAREMPVEFADVIDVGEDIEEAQKRIDKLDAAFKRAVEDAVNKRIAGTAPARGSTKTLPLTRDEYRRMTLRQQQELAVKDPELYKKMNE